MISETSVGALSVKSALSAVKFARSTDPDAVIKQPFKYPEPTDGFFHLRSRQHGTPHLDVRYTAPIGSTFARF